MEKYKWLIIGVAAGAAAFVVYRQINLKRSISTITPVEAVG